MLELVKFKSLFNSYVTYKVKTSWELDGKVHHSTDAFMVHLDNTTELLDGNILEEFTIASIGSYSPKPLVIGCGQVFNISVISDANISYDVDKIRLVFEEMFKLSYFSKWHLESVEVF